MTLLTFFYRKKGSTCICAGGAEKVLLQGGGGGRDGGSVHLTSKVLQATVTFSQIVHINFCPKIFHG